MNTYRAPKVALQHVVPNSESITDALDALVKATEMGPIAKCQRQLMAFALAQPSIPAKYRGKERRARVRMWLSALTSGEYQQGTGCLLVRHASNRFCCLGVYCDLRAKEGVGEWDSYDRATFLLGVDRERYDSDTDLPRPFAMELALPTPYEAILQALNDAGVTFDAIAGVLATWYVLGRYYPKQVRAAKALAREE